MDSATAAQLNALNLEFYRVVAPEFSASRGRLNPGIVEAFEGRDGRARMLDAGCGDGRVGLAWKAGELGMPWTAESAYLGFDRSGELLQARAPWPDGLTPVEGKLDHDEWPDGLFDLVCCFAALHHIPGRQARIAVLERIARSLGAGGTWVVSVWQFLHLERFQRRVVDWAEVDVDPERVEAGDVLLDWRRGPRALRYVHHYDREELAEDCATAGLRVERVWSSDGQGQELGLYLTGQAE